MDRVDEKIFKKLAGVHSAHSVSIYLPTVEKGLNKIQQAQLLLKDQLKELKRDFRGYQLNDSEIEIYIKPIKVLIEDGEFWRNQSEGLALFLNSSGLTTLRLPYHFDSLRFIADHHYLLPLAPLLHNHERYYVLALSQQSVHLFEARQSHLSEILIEDLAPARLEEVVGYDFEEKIPQFVSGDRLSGVSVFFGHGEGHDDKKDEIIRFLREVDKAVTGFIRQGERLPLVLACVNYLYPLYKQVNSYELLLDMCVSGNQEYVKVMDLGKKAWELVSEDFRWERKKKILTCQQLSATERVSYDIKDIIPYATSGRIDSLFILKDHEQYGLYDPAKNKVELHKERLVSNTSLINKAAVDTVLNGGRVYILEQEKMPLNHTEINAFCRY